MARGKRRRQDHGRRLRQDAGRARRWPALPRRARLLLVPALAALVGAALFSPAGADLLGLESDGPAGPPRAAVVDQLGATQPNPQFGESVKEILAQGGYQVEYFPPEAVNVEFYRNLPQGDYDLLVLRTHSTAEISKGEEDVSSVSVFTNEPYSRDRYYEEQLAGRIGFAQYTEGGDQFFGITAEFIRHGMKGRFHGTTIVMMGCQGLLNEMAAEAFASRGAGDYISWDGLVSAEHTDATTQRLLRHLAIDGQATGEAVRQTMDEVGPDPTYGSRLLFQP